MPLGDAQIRAIDTMKNNKDLMNNQQSDATIENIVAVLAAVNVTHIGHATPIDANSAYAGPNVPSPRTAEAFYKKWCDAIHEAGKKVLHRGTLCGIEGIWGFVRQVGGNRIAAGSYDEVVAPVFSDVFDRGSLGPNWQTAHQPGNDWSIIAGVLTGPVGDGWRRTCLTTGTYRNFTATARIKKIGTQQLVVRASTNVNAPGYGFQLRDGEFRLERPGLTDLSHTPKTFTENAWYWVKVQCSGTTIRGKAWAVDDATYPDSENGSENEPMSGLAAGAWDISTTHAEFASGYIGFSGEYSFGKFDKLTVTPVADYASHLGKVYQFIINNEDCFEDGDIWAVIPERTEGIFSDSTSFLSYAAPGIQSRYSSFFKDLKRVAETAFAAIDKDVICGQTANNFTEVDSGWINPDYFDEVGITVVDHYGTTHTVAEMESDLRRVHASRGKPVFLQEWGDYWNSAMEANARLAYLDEMYTMLGELAEEGVLIGFGYWGAWTGSQEGILTGNAPSYSLNSRGQKLAQHFAASSQTPDVTPPTVAITVPANSATVSGSVQVTADASDAIGVVGVQFKLDGVNLGAEITSAPYQAAWNTTGSENGSHVLTAVARDMAGNSATSASITITVNNVGPEPESPVWTKKYPRRGRTWTKKYA